jgi:hypothetical protein
MEAEYSKTLSLIPVAATNFKIKNLIIQRGPESVKPKYSLVLKGMFTFKPVSHFVVFYYKSVSSSLNMEDIILNNVCKFMKYFSVKFTNQLTDVLAPFYTKLTSINPHRTGWPGVNSLDLYP